MKNIFISILILVFFTSCYNIERNCQDFKTGKFEFEYEIDGIMKKTTFIRTENQEIDFYENKSDTSSIRWINDCEYVIQKINPKNREEQKAITMKILTTSKNSYTFEFGIVGSPQKQTGTVTKISE